MAAGLATFGWLSGCSVYQHEERPPWRAQAEQACLAKGLVTESASVRAFHEMDGPGICGLTHPFKVTALADGSVTLNSTATLDCPVMAALDGWIKDVVQPAALARFGEPVVRINSMGTYSCRGINNMSGARLSEHAFGNAIDIGGFVLASGRELNIMRGFNGSDEQERAFLHDAHAGACSNFTTVLGPGSNVFHYNHFHLDLAQHGSTSRGPRRYCKPVPEQSLPEPPRHDTMPDPPAIEEEIDMARAPLPEPALGGGGPSLMATVAEPGPGSRAARPYVPSPMRSAAPTATARAHLPSSREPPLVTFSYVEPPPAEPRRAARTVTAAPRPSFTPPAPIPAADASGPDLGTENPSPEEARSPLAQPRPEGAPADWDLTSSLGH